MNIRKLIRLILKIPATPFIIVWYGTGYVYWQIVRALEWVYEESDYTREISKHILNRDIKKPLKNGLQHFERNGYE